MPSVNILCFNNPLGVWDEDSLNVGVGGSETAVIGLARTLHAHEMDVRVFNEVPSIRKFDGVKYVPKDNLLRSEADIFIVWRDPSTLLAIKDSIGRKILWLHDLVPEEDILPFIHLCDVIWVPSLFHKGTYDKIPEEKFRVVPSGMLYKESVAPHHRDEHLLCYTSDYNRGLDILLNIWPQYLFKYPNDKLVIAYGPQTQEAIAKNMDTVRGDTLASKQWQYRWEYLQLRMKMKGVTHAGKLNKQQLADLYERASIMAYPSIFPETQCLVVIDALSHGCIPVTSSLGALQETNDAGYTLPPDVPMTDNAYLQILLGAREQVGEGRRSAARALAESYRWEMLFSKIKHDILSL